MMHRSDVVSCKRSPAIPSVREAAEEVAAQEEEEEEEEEEEVGSF